jgi:hypothetical protein
MFRPYPGQEWFTVDDAVQLIVPDFLVQGHLDVQVTANAIASVASAIDFQFGPGTITRTATSLVGADYVRISLLLPNTRPIKAADRAESFSVKPTTATFADLAIYTSPLGFTMYATPPAGVSDILLAVPVGSPAAVADGDYRITWLYSLLDRTPSITP